MADASEVDNILAPIAAWARSRADILGLAVVGSQARGTARPDSDIDVVVLTPEPERFRSDALWLAEIDWRDQAITDSYDAQYGSAWSRHVQLQSSSQIEFTFCTPSWTATNPIDPGTLTVVSGGCRVLVDKARLFGDLLTAASP